MSKGVPSGRTLLCDAVVHSDQIISVNCNAPIPRRKEYPLMEACRDSSTLRPLVNAMG